MKQPSGHSPYNLVHALAVTAILGAVVLSKGVGAFWTQFLHGLGTTYTPAAYLVIMASSAFLFGTLLLFLWCSTLFSRAFAVRRQLEGDEVPEAPDPPPDRRRALRTALRVALPLILVAFLLNGLGSWLVRLATGVTPADQDLVRLLADAATPFGVRALLSLAILFEAPLVEEPLFRGVVFRGFRASLPPWVAMALSGFLFALLHVNAASFLALWYLGIAFAALYHRTGTILAPMTVHFLFNATNLALVTFFPGLV